MGIINPMGLIQVLAIGISTLIVLMVIALIRRGRLTERYAILWLLACGFLMVFSIWRQLLDLVARALGFFYPPAFLFLAGFIFLMLILMHFSVVITGLSVKVRELTQQVALLKLDQEGRHKKDGPARGE